MGCYFGITCPSCYLSALYLISFKINYLFLAESVALRVVRRLCNNLEGWEGVGGEREVKEEGDTCIHMAGSC